MPKDPNRITVDLQLLRSQELEKLQAFGKMFEDSISSLKDAMGGYSGQLAGAAAITGRGGFGVTRAGQVSSGASVADAGVGGGAGHDGTTPGQTSKHASKGINPYEYAFAGPNINDYERGYFTVGNLANMSAVDMMRYLSHVTGERAGIVRNDDGSVSASNPSLARFSHRVGAGARGLNYGLTATKAIRGAINRAGNAGRSLTSFGQGLGMSSQNSFGIPFTSDAARYTLGRGLAAGRQSWFGLNPFYSSGQAQEAQGIAAQYGFVGQDANVFGGRLKSLYEDRGIDQNVSGSMLNAAFRQGGFTSVDALTQSLYSLRDAAQVAHMNTAQFTQDLQGLSQSLQQSGLASPFGASVQGQAYAAGSYLSPGAFGAAASSMPLNYMTMARTGQTLFGATHGMHHGSQTLQTQLGMIQSMAGVPMSQWAGLQKSNPRAFNQMMSRLMMVLQSPTGQQMFPGMTVDNLMKMAMGRGGATGAVGAARFQEDLISAQAADKQGNLTGAMVSALVHDARAGGQFNSATMARLGALNAMGFGAHGTSPHDALNIITSIQKKNRQLTGGQQRQLSIDLAPGAKKYFQIIDDVSNRNKTTNYSLSTVARKTVSDMTGGLL